MLCLVGAAVCPGCLSFMRCGSDPRSLRAATGSGLPETPGSIRFVLLYIRLGSGALPLVRLALRAYCPSLRPAALWEEDDSSSLSRDSHRSTLRQRGREPIVPLEQSPRWRWGKKTTIQKLHGVLQQLCVRR